MYRMHVHLHTGCMYFTYRMHLLKFFNNVYSKIHVGGLFLLKNDQYVIKSTEVGSGPSIIIHMTSPKKWVQVPQSQYT